MTINVLLIWSEDGNIECYMGVLKYHMESGKYDSGCEI